jgi:hypothetical protein
MICDSKSSPTIRSDNSDVSRSIARNRSRIYRNSRDIHLSNTQSYKNLLIYKFHKSTISYPKLIYYSFDDFTLTLKVVIFWNIVLTNVS